MKKLLENKTFQIIYTIIKVFVVAMLSIYLLFVIVQRFTNNSSILGYRVFTIATGSMEPVYNIDDVILVKDTDPSTLKGVNNKYEDPSITEDQILGKVVGKLPVVNFINHVVKNIYGFFFLVFCPLVLVIFLEIADTIIDMKLEKNEIRLIEKEDKKSKKKNKKENISNNEELDEDVDTDTSVLDSDV